jgi:hypothetical protein
MVLPIEAANAPALYIDLSNASWPGEPGLSFEMAWSAVKARINAGRLNTYLQADPHVVAGQPARLRQRRLRPGQ